ncbi:MAG: FixH family protein [Gallionellaceae bacterium]
MISQKNKGWRNPWVIGLILIVLSGIFINMRFLWNVMQHPTRVLDENYNVKKHNQYDANWVKQQAERSTLGWQAKLHSPSRLPNDSMAMESAARFILIGNPAELQFELNDNVGKPVQGGQVVINAQWPGDPQFDATITLNETAPGRYAGSMKFPRPGNWDMLIKVTQDGRMFDMEQKVFVSVSK